MYRLPEGMHEYKIYLPLYVGLESLEIGLSEGAKVEKAPAYKIKPSYRFGLLYDDKGNFADSAPCLGAGHLFTRCGIN